MSDNSIDGPIVDPKLTLKIDDPFLVAVLSSAEDAVVEPALTACTNARTLASTSSTGNPICERRSVRQLPAIQVHTSRDRLTLATAALTCPCLSPLQFNCP